MFKDAWWLTVQILEGLGTDFNVGLVKKKSSKKKKLKCLRCCACWNKKCLISLKKWESQQELPVTVKGGRYERGGVNQSWIVGEYPSSWVYNLMVTFRVEKDEYSTSRWWMNPWKEWMKFWNDWKLKGRDLETWRKEEWEWPVGCWSPDFLYFVLTLLPIPLTVLSVRIFYSLPSLCWIQFS